MRLPRLRVTVRRALIAMAVVAFNLALADWGLGSLPHYLVVLVLVPIGLSCLLTRSSMPKPGRASLLAAVGAVTASTLLSLPIGHLVCLYEVDRAKRFCDAMRPALERYRDATGSYPSEASRGRRVPRLLRQVRFYERREGGYRFLVPDPSRIFAAYEFDSRSGDWYYWD
jgi:hypothetical protein